MNQKQHFDSPAHNRVTVDRPGEVIEELDDQLGQMIPRGRSPGKKEGAGRHFQLRVFPQTVVYSTTIRRAFSNCRLYFMNTFDLAVENGIRVDSLIKGSPEPIGKLQLSLARRLAEGILERGIIGKRLESA